MQTKFEKQMKAAVYTQERVAYWDEVIERRKKRLATRSESKEPFEELVRSAADKRARVAFDLNNLKTKLGIPPSREIES